jgi:DNA-binding LacI/PurR family transcriptional regulator
MTTPMRRANQADIAERLGVSISTVSRALANETGISDTVRRDVQEMARALGYKSKHLRAVPNDRRAVALVPLGGATSGLSGFYFGIVEGMRSGAAAADIALDLRLVDERTVTLDLMRRHIAQADATGLLLAGIDAGDDLATWCAEAGIAAVLVNGSDPLMRLSSVSPANFYGAYLATQRLLDAGHRRIMHYMHRGRPTLQQRLRGFEAAMAATPGAEGVVVDSAECATGELLERLLAGKYDATALFCWNDIAAVQILEGIYGGGTGPSLPLSIVGFDDLPLAGMSSPRLSTIRVDREAIGRGAIRLLKSQMDGDPTIQQLEIGVSAVAGGTVHELVAQ